MFLGLFKQMCIKKVSVTSYLIKLKMKMSENNHLFFG